MLPTRQAIELPLLQEIDVAGGALRPNDAYRLLQGYFPEITDDDLRALIPSGQDNQWTNWVRWTRQSLVDKGYIHRLPRGIWRITPQGRRHIRRHSRQASTIRDGRGTYAGRAPRQSDPEERRRVQEAAMTAALSWERSQGRRARSVEPENRGYDIEARGGKEVRFIEVKGLSGSGPVEMTRNEMEQSQKIGENYYLYVLEYALLPQARLYVVANPYANCQRIPSNWAVFWQ